VVTSAGAAAENHASQYVIDIVLLAGEGPKEAERHVTITRRRFQDLNLSKALAREAECAVDRLSAGLPTPGATPVVFGPHGMGEVIDFLVSATSGQAIYRRESSLKVGRPIFREGSSRGEPLILELNALFPFGPKSYRIDEEGVAGRNVRVIDDGVLITPHAGPQYAHYLELPGPTGAPGTPQMPPGRQLEKSLRSGSYLEIVELSALWPSLASGRFSAEIRFGYEVRRGSKRPVAGGTVSGNIFEALASARYSKEVGLHDAYVGPNLMRVETLRIEA
jgi:PmbA protein